MGFRTISIKKRCKLSYSLNYLIIRGEEESKVFLSEVNRIILQSTQISITTSLLSELSKRKIKLIVCDEKHNPEAELMPYYGCHNSSLKIRNQILWENTILEEVWSKIISLKIKNQIEVLNKYNLSDGAKLLYGYLNDIKPGDITNREGHAAKVYFNSLFGSDFSRKQKSIFNDFLNYGYTILLSMFNREITSKGYLTQLGIHHKNEYNNFNLSCDLMEPFRPIIDDYAVSSLINENNYRSIFNNLANISVVFAGKNTFLENAVILFVEEVFKIIELNLNININNIESYEL